MERSRIFIPGSSNHNLQPININTARDKTHLWYWSSNHKGYIRARKSIACSTVLQLMDQDYSYQAALAKVLKENAGLDKPTLEKELSKYI